MSWPSQGLSRGEVRRLTASIVVTHCDSKRRFRFAKCMRRRANIIREAARTGRPASSIDRIERPRPRLPLQN